ncbi:hypothetical protein, partial [Gemmiger formicilis]|uniref:hypothetical protein n=1 Tax=Gemmiger formicilis TaxID=745368 RepID=UPI00195F0BD0
MISDCARELCRNTGYDELSLTSLSTSDHSRLAETAAADTAAQHLYAGPVLYGSHNGNHKVFGRFVV